MGCINFNRFYLCKQGGYFGAFFYEFICQIHLFFNVKNHRRSPLSSCSIELLPGYTVSAHPPHLFFAQPF